MEPTPEPSPPPRPLPPPRRLRAELFADAAVRSHVARARDAVRGALHGRDPRLLAIVGPCSIHDPDAALEYAERLAALALRTRHALVVVMRTYLEKPRTALGWKGLVNDPDLDGRCDVARGLRLARETLLGVNRLGMGCAGELLDPLCAPYLADLLAWCGVGARTAESQTHRERASGAPMPVGLKNATDGSVEAARDAMLAAGHPHRFPALDEGGAAVLVSSRGNPDRHLVLRGGRAGPNHGPEHVARAAALVADQGIARPVLVDCSHGNSGRDPAGQAVALRSVAAQVRAGQPALLGVALESNLHPGRQDWRSGARLARGVSITDACIGWPETERLLFELADAAAGARRSAA